MSLYKSQSEALLVAEIKLFAVKCAIEFAIATTPTGERRDKLTEANIYLRNAEYALKAAKNENTNY